MTIPGVSEMAFTLNNMSNILTNPAMMYKEPPVVKAYVVSKEMTNQQSADKRIKNLSRL
jgi:replicative DNA helicase